MKAPNRPLLAALSGISILAATAACSTSSSTGSGDAGAAVAPATPGTYKDGTYSAEGSYASPGGTENVKVDVTLAKNVVTAVTVTPEARDANGQIYQGRFAQGISAVVVGKDISTLKVTKVSGSSLTGAGFNDALAKIKAEAGA